MHALGEFIQDAVAVIEFFWFIGAVVFGVWWWFFDYDNWTGAGQSFRRMTK